MNLNYNEEQNMLREQIQNSANLIMIFISVKKLSNQRMILMKMYGIYLLNKVGC
jgi:hypothetical protein